MNDHKHARRFLQLQYLGDGAFTWELPWRGYLFAGTNFMIRAAARKLNGIEIWFTTESITEIVLDHRALARVALRRHKILKGVRQTLGSSTVAPYDHVPWVIHDIDDWTAYQAALASYHKTEVKP